MTRFHMSCVAALFCIGLGSTAGTSFSGTDAASPQGPTAFDFQQGTWSMVKDGFSFTVEAGPILGGAAWQEFTILDENNRLTSTAITSYSPTRGVWTRTQFSNSGWRTTFAQPEDSEELVLEQVSFNGRAFNPAQSRLFYEQKSLDRYVMDWQSRDERGRWQPRPEPFTYVRVDRPERPGGPGRIAFISKRTGDWEIFTMAPDGTDVRNLTNDPAGDHYPNWIAGGTRIAFRSQRGRDDDGWDRWEIDIDGTDLLRVAMPDGLHQPDMGTFPEIHPSGSYVINAAERDGEQDLYVWRFDGGGERVLAAAPGLDYRPRFSPDGSRVVFVSERDGNAEIYTVAFDGSDLQRLTTSPGIDRYAQWAPDGSRIAFASDRDGSGLEIYVMDADGSNPRRITTNDSADGEVTWSPDGKFLAFRSEESGDAEICVADLETGEIRNLTQNEAYDGEPVWSPQWF